MTRSLRWLPILCALGLFLAGCEGGGGEGISSLMPGSANNQMVVSGSTILRIHLPPGTTVPQPTSQRGAIQASSAMSTTNSPIVAPTAFASIAPTGVSPSPFPVAAMTVSVTGAAALTQTVNLTSGSTGCTSSPNGGLCQVGLPLPPGTYQASIALYGSTVISPATLLSTPQSIAFNVSSLSAAPINLTLAGAPAQVSVVPASPTAVVNAQGGIDLYGAGKHQLLVEMLDNKQNIIVGTSSPSFTLAQAGGSLPLTIAQSNTTSSNLFTVSAPPVANTATATVRASPNVTGATMLCANAAMSCTANVTVDVRQMLAVANSSANTVTLYAGQTSPMIAVQQNVADPQAVIFDTSGNLFVANQPGSVTEYAPPYTQTTATISQGINHPQALALDSHGNLFVANGNGSNTITEYSPPFTGAPSVTIAAGINDPVGVTVDANNNLFVANQAANTVTEYASPYANAPVTISNGLAAPSSLAIDGHENLFVANSSSTPNSVVEYTAPFSSSSAPAVTIANGINEQGAIGLGSAATLFVPNQGANTVTQYVAPYTGTPTTITGGQNQPMALAVDALGNLYVANYGNNTVTQYAPPYNSGSWTTIASGVANPMAVVLSPPTSTSSAIVP